MQYHPRNRSEDGFLQMPADGSTFRNIEEKSPDFKRELHNLRFSLAADAVNPFGGSI